MDTNKMAVLGFVFPLTIGWFLYFQVPWAQGTEVEGKYQFRGRTREVGFMLLNTWNTFHKKLEKKNVSCGT